MPTTLYILDFDRTIFDTLRFFYDIKSTLEQSLGLNGAEFDRTWNNFFDPEVGGYDLHAHHHQLLGISPDELNRLIASELGNRDYTFPDAAGWLQERDHDREEVVVMTMGLQRYQELKFRHCALVKRLHKVVVRENKGAVIRRHFNQHSGEYNLDFLNQSNRPIVLIDDSAETFTALGPTDRITGVRIARPGQRYSEIPTPPHIRHITSFGELS